MQCRCRQCDADRLADRQLAQVVDHILPRSDPHRVAVETTGIRALHDFAPQYETAIVRPIGRTKSRFLAAEMRSDGRAVRPGSAPLSGERRSIKHNAVAC